MALQGVTLEYNTKQKLEKITIKPMAKNQEVLEDLIDGIIYENSKDEPRISHETLIAKLKKQGRLS